MWSEIIWHPDNQGDDLLAWASNQLGHAFFVGVLIFTVFRFLKLSPWFGAALYGLFEIWHWLIGGTVADGLTDWVFVIAGVHFANAAWGGNRDQMRLIWFAIAALVGVGVFLRSGVL